MPTERSQSANSPDLETCPLGIADEHHSVFCPTCSSRLAESRCKLHLPQPAANFRGNCADFY